MKQIIDYIIRFLLYGNQDAAKLVAYTADESQWHNYRVVIVPNGHLGQDIVLPDLSDLQITHHCTTTTTPPQHNCNTTATQPQHHCPTTATPPQHNCHTTATPPQHNCHIIHTDIIYNTFFFISRAEEIINTQRDQHNRFLAKYSILGQNNRLMIPTVDEYARLLMKLLDLPLPTPSFSHIYLTHDIDSIAHYRHWRGAIGGILRGQWRHVFASRKDIHNDPAFTFSWLISRDKKVEGAKCIYFIKDTEGKGYDYPQYKLDGKDFETAKQLIENSGAKIGLHSSYYGITQNSKFKIQKTQNSKFKIQNLLHRSHYLRCSIDQMQTLADAGIQDDFTMMFPDQVGFRLQTTRPVRWINPITMTLTPLTLHPLTVMDCTLSNTNYMHLNEDEAYFECQRLFDKIHQNAGEAVILWHNTNPTGNTYHRTLYPKLLALLEEYR